MTGFIIKDNQKHQECLDFIEKLDISKSWEIVVKPFKINRSTRQNRFMWAIYEQLEKQTGTDKEYYHIYFKGRFLGAEDVEIMGEKKRITKSTTKLKKAEFAEYMTKVIAAITTAGYYISMPYDYNELFN